MEMGTNEMQRIYPKNSHSLCHQRDHFALVRFYPPNKQPTNQLMIKKINRVFVLTRRGWLNVRNMHIQKPS